ncbi:MAG: hypothetical protein MJ209_05115 [archaeon]|nr:hypothetical protein [archaeon]
MKKVLIKFSFILLFFLLIGTTYAEDIENENITCETKKNTTIESDDLEMFYCDGSSFQIKLTGEDVSNKIVSMSINGVSYYPQTNKEGYASLPIRLYPNNMK